MAIMGVAMSREEMVSLLSNKDERANYMFITSQKVASQSTSIAGNPLPPSRNTIRKASTMHLGKFERKR
jgi:hypothetical protein